MPAESIRDRLSELYGKATLLIHVLLLRLTYFFRGTLSHLALPPSLRKSPYRRTIAIIGDGIAEGVGDTLAHGGPCFRVQKLINEARDKGEVKMQWSVVSFGRLNCDSSHWAISRDSTLFEKTFVTGQGKGVDIVVVICGGGEDLDDALGTVERIRNIAESLVRLDKEVIVANIPFYGDPKSAGAKKAAERNRLLQSTISNLPQNSETNARVSCSLDLQSVVSRGPDVLWEDSPRTTLNVAGYRSFSRLIMDELLNPARRVEWRVWKPKLESSRASEGASE